MGLGRFQLDDDGQKVVAPPSKPPEAAARPSHKVPTPLPPPGRSASPELEPAAPAARPASPNILRYTAAAKESHPAANGMLYTIQHGGISASASSPMRPLVFVGAVTSSVDIPSAFSGKAARRLTNPRLAAETAARAGAETGVGNWMPSCADGYDTVPATAQPARASLESERLNVVADTATRDETATTPSAEGAEHEQLSTDQHKDSGGDQSGAARRDRLIDRIPNTPGAEHSQAGLAALAMGAAPPDVNAGTQVAVVHHFCHSQPCAAHSCPVFSS